MLKQLLLPLAAAVTAYGAAIPISNTGLVAEGAADPNWAVFTPTTAPVAPPPVDPPEIIPPPSFAPSPRPPAAAATAPGVPRRPARSALAMAGIVGALTLALVAGMAAGRSPDQEPDAAAGPAGRDPNRRQSPW